jgi:hypothetical protein
LDFGLREAMPAGEKLTAFLELESAIRGTPEIGKTIPPATQHPTRFHATCRLTMRLSALRRTGRLGRFMPFPYHFTLVVKAARGLSILLLAFKCRYHIEFEVFHELLS